MPSDENNDAAAAKEDAAGDATLYLEQQKFDFESNRIQLILAAILFLIMGFLNYAPYLNLAMHEPLVGAITRNNLIYPWTIKAFSFLSAHAHSFYDVNAQGPQFGDVILFCLSAFFVTLISLELTGLNGNRLKTTAGIWAGLLFVLFPIHANETINYVGHVDIVASTFYLASIAFFLRYQLLKENMYIVIAGFTGLICIFMQASNWTLLVVLLFAYLLVRPLNPNRPAAPGTDAVAKTKPANLAWRPILFLLVWGGLSFLATGTSLYLEYLSISSLTVVFSAPFCILLANFLLPGFYTANHRRTRAAAAIGCAILSGMIILWSLALKINFDIMTRLPAGHYAF